MRRVLEEALTPVLEPLAKPIPPETIWEMRRDYGELLPKTSRSRTIFFDSRREPGVKAAERIGLVRMMRSASLPRLRRGAGRPQAAHGLGPAGAALRAGRLCRPAQRPPSREPGCQGAATSTCISACARRASTHQWLVYSRAGHFSEIVSVAAPATVTAYRLPFWHYTTPLCGTAKAARWVSAGTFLYQRPEGSR